jgi:uncharacterized membrane protein YozB (DUF420 family)
MEPLRNSNQAPQGLSGGLPQLGVTRYLSKLTVTAFGLFLFVLAFSVFYIFINLSIPACDVRYEDIKITILNSAQLLVVPGALATILGIAALIKAKRRSRKEKTLSVIASFTLLLQFVLYFIASWLPMSECLNY